MTSNKRITFKITEPGLNPGEYMYQAGDKGTLLSYESKTLTARIKPDKTPTTLTVHISHFRED